MVYIQYVKKIRFSPKTLLLKGQNIADFKNLQAERRMVYSLETYDLQATVWFEKFKADVMTL